MDLLKYSFTWIRKEVINKRLTHQASIAATRKKLEKIIANSSTVWTMSWLVY